MSNIFGFAKGNILWQFSQVMMRFVFLRHGRTSWNEAGLLQGSVDIPLSEAGRSMVHDWVLPNETNGGTNEGFNWVGCYSSPLVRAYETAEIVCGGMGLDIVRDERLREMGFGIWEGYRLSEIRHRLRFVMERLEGCGVNFAAPGGESPYMVGLRLLDFLRDIWQIYDGEGDVLCVAHKGVIRALYVLASGWDMVSAPQDRLDMTRLQSFGFDGKDISFLSFAPVVH